MGRPTQLLAGNKALKRTASRGLTFVAKQVHVCYHTELSTVCTPHVALNKQSGC